MKKAILTFNDVRLNPSEIHKFRGYVGNVFAEYDLIHNHDPETGKTVYRYPLIQFKIIGRTPSILAFTDEAIGIFTKIFMGLNEIDIEGRKIRVNEKELEIRTVEFGFSQDTHVYEFVSPWIALNQSNYKKYNRAAEPAEQNTLLERILTGNILSMAKNLDCRLGPDQRIATKLNVREIPVNLKGNKMIGFKGIFQTNFLLPDHAGLGKSVSRGFGCIEKRL